MRSSDENPRIGVVGGSGLYGFDGLEEVREHRIETPYGPPSDLLVSGRLEDREVVFLARHRRDHSILPSELNFRANVYALKVMGVRWIVGVGAVGSMKSEVKPTDIVVPDQFVDRTRHRADTFFGDGVVAHVSLADPVCPTLRGRLVTAAGKAGARVHDGGTYLCMEGPQFSTRAESEIYRQWGVDVIGMTNLQEAKLAREAEICYASLALVTDYDCWHQEEEDVTVEGVLEVLRQNAAMAQDVVRRAVRRFDVEAECACQRSLDTALITDLHAAPEETVQRLGPIVGRFLAGGSEEE